MVSRATRVGVGDRGMWWVSFRPSRACEELVSLFNSTELVIVETIITETGFQQPYFCRCCQHRASTGPVLALNGMFTGSETLVYKKSVIQEDKNMTWHQIGDKAWKYLIDICYLRCALLTISSGPRNGLAPCYFLEKWWQKLCCLWVNSLPNIAFIMHICI